MAILRFVPAPAAVMPQPSEELSERVDAAIRAADAMTMDVLTTGEQLSERLSVLRRRRSTEVVLCELGGGVLNFVAAAFPGLERRCVFAQHFRRETLGRGAHFDVYGELLDDEFPWVAVFNVAGDAEISAFPLPEILARRYRQEHSATSDEAFEARRRIATEALKDFPVHLSRGVLYRHRGLIIPQLKAGPHWVHHIVPVNPDTPGQFVKLLIPSNDEGTVKQLGDKGYAPLDGVLTAALEALPEHRRRCNLD
jgi:hypothetical protein